MARSIFGYLEQEGGKRGLRIGRGLARHEEWTEAILPADAEVASPEGETSRRPLVVFGFVVGVLTMVLMGRLFALQIIAGDHNLALANGNRIRERVERAPRGIIYDRNHVPLASNQASYDVTVVPQLLPRAAGEQQAVYGRLAAILNLPVAEVATRTETGCVTHRREDCLLSPLPQLVVPSISREQALLVEQSSATLTGFAIDVNPIRQYDDGGMLSVFLGYTGRINADEVVTHPQYRPTDLIGKLGLEKQYEADLRGQNGGEQTEVDATGRAVRVVASRESVPGNSLVLSIDKDLQNKLAESIKRQMDAAGSKRAAGIAMNPKTGEVLAAVSLPSYDNNLFSRGISAADYEHLVKDPGQPLFNKVANGAYPSGSIIKPLGVAAALQEGVITIATTIIDSGLITVPNKYDPSKPTIYRGWEREHGLGVMSPLTAISRSSDIFFYKVMGGLFGTNEDFTHPLGVNKLTDYYKKFGLGARTGIDLPSEAAGRVPTPDWKKAFSGDAWYTGDTYNISVGQGDMLVSPLQMVTALSAVANGGTLYRPHLVSQIVDTAGKVVRAIAPETIRQGIAGANHLATVRRGMWMAVNDDNGTACCKIKAEVPVQVAGKTGTAETVVTDTGVDAKLQSRPHAWFEAFAPYDDPQIAIVVLVEHSGEGSQFAAPAVRETLSWYFTAGAGAKRQ